MQKYEWKGSGADGRSERGGNHKTGRNVGWMGGEAESGACEARRGAVVCGEDRDRHTRQTDRQPGHKVGIYGKH